MRKGFSEAMTLRQTFKEEWALSRQGEVSVGKSEKAIKLPGSEHQMQEKDVTRGCWAGPAMDHELHPKYSAKGFQKGSDSIFSFLE